MSVSAMNRLHEHQRKVEEMVAFLKASLRPGVWGSSSSPILTLLNGMPRREQSSRWHLRKVAAETAALFFVSTDDIRRIVGVKWAVPDEEVLKGVITRLLASGFLVGTGPSAYKLYDFKPVNPPVSETTLGGWRKAKRDFGKAGVCPTCGVKVKNKNRHANPEHRETECKLNQVAAVLKS